MMARSRKKVAQEESDQLKGLGKPRDGVQLLITVVKIWIAGFLTFGTILHFPTYT